MAKVHTYSLKPNTPSIYRRDFTDEDQPGMVLTLYLQTPDPFAAYSDMDIRETYRKKYITGDQSTNSPTPPMIFPVLDGRVILITDTVINVFCDIVASQPVYIVGTVMQWDDSLKDFIAQPSSERRKNEDYYDFDELIFLAAKAPDTWLAIQNFAADIIARSVNPKNSSRASTEITSDLPNASSIQAMNSNNGVMQNSEPLSTLSENLSPVSAAEAMPTL